MAVYYNNSSQVPEAVSLLFVYHYNIHLKFKCISALLSNTITFCLKQWVCSYSVFIWMLIHLTSAYTAPYIHCVYRHCWNFRFTKYSVRE